MRHLFCVENIDRCGSNWLLRTKMGNFDRKVWIFGAKSQFLCFEIMIFVNRAHHQYSRGNKFPIQTTPKKFCFWAMGYFPGLTPFFGHFEPFPLCYYKYPYFWTVVNETWWDRPCHKKMTHNDSGPGPGQNYREKAVFTFVFTFVFLAKTLFLSFS